VDILVKECKRKDLLIPMTEEIAMYLIKNNSTNNEDHDYLFGVADVILRAAKFQVFQAKWLKAKQFATYAFDILEFLAARKPKIRLLPNYEIAIRLTISIYPELHVVQQAYEWALPLNRPRLVARILTTMIFRLTFVGLELGSLAAPNTPNMPVQPNDLQIILPLIDQLELALYNGKYHTIEDPILPYTATVGNVLRSTLKALRSYYQWDLVSALESIEDCAIEAPLTYDFRSDSNLVLDIAACISVQLFGLAVSTEYSTPISYIGQRGVKRLANWTELLLRFSRLSPWPWGKYLNDWNDTIFKNFLSRWHPDDKK